MFDIPAAMLPDVRDCASDFGVCDASVLGMEIPVCGMAGDQQAAIGNYERAVSLDAGLGNEYAAYSKLLNQ